MFHIKPEQVINFQININNLRNLLIIDLNKPKKTW